MGRRQDKGRLPPFVPLLIATIEAPAWRALSHGAARLYIALRRRYGPGLHNNGRIYLSQRDAHEELRSDRKQVARWFRELQHYGFIVQVTPGYLGLDGKGKAPHWRLTELGTKLEPPTRDFLSWKGLKFRDAEIQNPGGGITSRVEGKSPPPPGVKSPPPIHRSGGEITPISAPEGGGEITPVSRFTTPCAHLVRASNLADDMAMAAMTEMALAFADGTGERPR